MVNYNSVNDVRKSSPLVLLYCLTMICCYILPALKYSIPYMALGALLLLTYVMCVHNSRIDVNPYFFIILAACVLGTCSFLVTQPGNLTEAINEIIRALRFLAPAILYLFLNGNGKTSYTYMKIISTTSVALFLYITIQTLIAIEVNPMIARILAYGLGISDEMAAYRHQNVGGFEFSYSVGFMTVILLYMTMSQRMRWKKVLWGMLLSLNILFVIRVQYMTLLILTMAFLVILLLKVSPNRLWKIILIILAGIFIILIPTLANYLSQNVEETMLAYKFGNFSNFFSSGDFSELGKRPRYLLEAIERFLRSPLWGNKIVDGGSIMAEYNEVHSTFFGYLQNMGIIGWSCFYFPIFMMTKRIERSFVNSKSQTVYRLIVAMFVVLSILNPINYGFEICFTVFLIIPCILRSAEEHYGAIENGSFMQQD